MPDIFVFALVIGVSWIIIPVLNKKISPPERKKSTYNNTSDYQNNSQANSDNGDYSGENDNDSNTHSDGILSEKNNIEKKYAKILNLKGKVNINDDDALEKEADVMGSKALQVSPENNTLLSTKNSAHIIQKNAVHIQFQSFL